MEKLQCTANSVSSLNETDIYLFIYNIRHEMHKQNPIVMNNNMKGCRDIKNNTIQKFNNNK